MSEEIDLSDPHVVAAVTYCRAIVAKEIPASKLTIAACKRQLDDLERWATDPDYPFYFDEGAAGRPCRFLELLPHIKGPKANAGELIVLEPWQSYFVTTIYGWRRKDNGKRRFRRVYLEVARGNAKALDTSTPIPTPSGWTTMADLRPGDQVFDESGSVCNVVAATEVMHDRECFELEFSTGEKIIADADHEWLTHAKVNRVGDRAGRDIKRFRPPSLSVYRSAGALAYVAQLYGKQIRLGAVARLTEEQAMLRFVALAADDLDETPIGLDHATRIRTTREIFETQDYATRRDRNHSIDVAKPLDLPELRLPIPPYVLGAWLGDGHSAAGRITCAYTDLEIIENIRSEGVTAEERVSGNPNCGNFILGRHRKGGGLFDSLASKLRGLGVLNNKHIPQAYLRASRGQRQALLQGLMDTDGTCSTPQGQCSLVATFEALARGVYELAASLGLRPTIRERRARLYGRDCGPVWHVSFHAYNDFPVFRLRRKFAHQVSRPARGSLQNVRMIRSVKAVPSVPVKCIQVDSPSKLYLAGRGFIPTHNSTMLAGLALYALAADGEQGAEVVSAATTTAQAKIVHGVAEAMLKKKPELRNRLGLRIVTHAIVQERSTSKFWALSREADNQDGLNMHLGVIDELHAHRTRETYDVLETALAKRDQSMIVVITTAGSDTSGICYEIRTFVVKMLQGSLVDESQFGLIYTIDEEDTWHDPACWPKANPNWGVSVMPDVVASLAAKAQAVASATNNFKTKHLNVWCSADVSWMDMGAWDTCGDATLKIEDFAGADLWIGFDLASRSDLACRARLFCRDHPKPVQTVIEGIAGLAGKPPVERHWYLFLDSYLPEDRVENAANASYEGWARNGWIKTTPGQVLDFAILKADTLEDRNRFKIIEAPYDPYQATQFAGELLEEDVPMVEYRNTVLMMSPPMKELEALVLSGRFHHDANPCMRWMISNVVCHRDAKDNIFPRKERHECKIDGPVATIMALGRGLANAVEINPYESHGIRFVGGDDDDVDDERPGDKFGRKFDPETAEPSRRFEHPE